MGDELRRALERLDLVEVGERLGLLFEGLPSRGHGLCKSPLRVDRHPSFHVVADGGRAVGFVDYGLGDAPEAKGSIYDLVKLARPQWTDREASDYLIDLAGTRRPPAPKASGVPSVAGGAKELSAAAARRKREEERRGRVEERVAEQYRLPLAAPPPEGAPLAVIDRYWAGQDWAFGNGERVAALAARRGWPVDWADELVSAGAMSCPGAPWCEEFADKGHFWAFRVEAPERPMAEGPVERLAFLGYHQCYYVDGERKWVYVPYLTRSERRSGFQRALSAYYALRGKGPGDSLVDPAPFFIGDRAAPRLVCIAEGQWDAITAYGALGGFDDGEPPPVAVFGLRGVNSMEHLLRYWGRWLRWVARQEDFGGVWLLADCDDAGRKGLESRGASAGVVDRLAGMLGCRVVAAYPRVGSEIKDFNDYFRAKQPTRAAMWRWAAALGLCGE